MIQTVNETRLSQFFYPVASELDMVENELNKMIQSSGIGNLQDIVNDIGNMPDKYLRAGIVLLAAKSVGQKHIMPVDSQIIRLASIMELIYYAVFVHNRVIEQKEKCSDINDLDNKISVLAGDSLYTRAFFEATRTLPVNMFQAVSDLTLKMCLAEIKEEVLKSSSMTLEEYFEVIEEKTAIFFSVCCRLGANLVSAEETETMHLERIGNSLGMIYQASLDYSDEQQNLPADFSFEKLSSFAMNAENSLSFIKDSIYTRKLIELLDYFLAQIK